MCGSAAAAACNPVAVCDALALCARNSRTSGCCSARALTFGGSLASREVRAAACDAAAPGVIVKHHGAGVLPVGTKISLSWSHESHTGSGLAVRMLAFG